MSDFVTIATYYDYLTANLDKQKLEENEVICYLADENTITLQWLLGIALGGIKLRVIKSEADLALDILSDRNSEIKVDHRIELDPGVEILCPSCKSNNVGIEKLTSFSRWAFVITGLPINTKSHPKLYRCFFCDNAWEK